MLFSLTYALKIVDFFGGKLLFQPPIWQGLCQMIGGYDHFPKFVRVNHFDPYLDFTSGGPKNPRPKNHQGPFCSVTFTIHPEWMEKSGV